MTKQSLLATLRTRLKVDANDNARQQVVAERLQLHPRNTVPIRTHGTNDELLARFEDMLGRVKGTTARVPSIRHVPAAVSDYLRRDGNDVAGPVCLSDELRGNGLSWADANIELVDWQSRTSYRVCVTGCIGAAAETGTIAIASSATTPLSQNFLGDQHIVVLARSQLFGSYEAIWDKVRGAGVPRHVTFVSGPSCTGDIEMIMEYGAHGPRNLHVLIVLDA